MLSSECWLYAGSKTEKGYGRMHINGKTHSAHRVMYIVHKGEIPEGLEIDHLCRVTSCINPDHLEAVTHLENMLRVPNYFSLRKYCIKGHPFDESNTWLRHKKGQARKHRVCNQCNRDRMKAYMKKKYWEARP